jgi:hypothetical protein
MKLSICNDNNCGDEGRVGDDHVITSRGRNTWN